MGGNQHPLRVGIWGHYHGGNLGDDLVVATLIRIIRTRHPDAEIFGVSLDPADTSRRHQIPAISIRNGTTYRDGERIPSAEADASLLTRIAGILERGSSNVLMKAARKMRALSSVLQAWKMLRGTDMLLVAGSHPLCDSRKGPWRRPYNLFKWALLARVTRTRFVPLNVGAGPLETPLSRFFVRRALRMAHYRSFRDACSAEVAASIGAKGHNPVFPDLAFSLPQEEIEPRRMGARTNGKQTGGEPEIVGISTVAHEDPRYLPRGDVSRYQAYLGKLTAFATRLLNEGYTLLLLRSKVEADERVATDLKNRLAAQGMALEGRVITAPTRTHRDLLDQIARCEIVVGGRFHCHVLPFLLGKPVLGLAHHAKTFSLMRYMGQSEYCLDIDDVSVRRMIDRFERLRARRAAVIETIEERVRTCREVLDFQYHLLLREKRLPALSQNYLPTSDGRALEGVGIRLDRSPVTRTQGQSEERTAALLPHRQ